MTVKEDFDSIFSEENLKEIFTEYIAYSSATGIDSMNQNAFRRQVDQQISIISNKAISGNYKFSKYKLKLISKGRNKAPREISIPTIRDRVALKALCKFLQDRFSDSVTFELPQEVIKDVKSEALSGRYNGFIKLDISNFYPSIPHDKLISKLKQQVQSQEILDIISSAIKSPTVLTSKKDDPENSIGIPQGLSISNILAAIYLESVDKHLSSLLNIRCYRYVDDVLILCSQAEANELSKTIISKFSELGLEVHDPITTPEKSKIDFISKGFEYLGYTFTGDKVSARAGSVDKLKSSLAGIFTSYKHSRNKSLAILEWRLNLRITGCVFEKKCKGWQFFFSEINYESLLHELDIYVRKLTIRFGVEHTEENNGITPKKFVRTFKEIIHRKHQTSYIPNFDNYTIQDMSTTLSSYFEFDIARMTEEDISYYFHKKIGAQVRDLEVDVKDFGYQ
ncbi:RNA-dependent DNA polymerase [Marinomonas rhizomae]|uniref:Retron-type reverse transcriptase n=1 Tax=Marinomonas rhizomae TaxID=491948 RepID=A0A366J9E9_9GAMM|nr:reverse transcriptase domain-containing protein [Marinomonas rhizomae]RBP83050.1 retron-type reverse transcriptase [Marinomonas rhizomae]RNF72645.1 RNA-dependent DNA polymerase [Marinomonas rhizomae]